jgi:uncharacterized protein (DUF1501 family)
MNRRTFLDMMCVGGLAPFRPRTIFARAQHPGRLLFVLLRGGLDGLAAVVPYGDPVYRATRGSLAYDARNLVPLSPLFGLSPGLAALRELWDRDELVVLHAMAIPYRTRSHFEAQAVLESGTVYPATPADGWVNRLVQVMSGKRSGIAIASGMLQSLSCGPDVQGLSSIRPDVDHGNRTTIAPMMRAVARIMCADDGPVVAAMEFGGWDTHANQGLGGGALDRRLGELADGLLALRSAMGPVWKNTMVVVMTEFGRTVQSNGARGTEHGTAGAGFLLGPRLARSAIHCDWPGLDNSALFEGRDLRPSLDTRTVLKAAIAGTFDLTGSQLDRVFPLSSSVRAPTHLMA